MVVEIAKGSSRRTAAGARSISRYRCACRIGSRESCAHERVTTKAFRGCRNDRVPAVRRPRMRLA